MHRTLRTAVVVVMLAAAPAALAQSRATTGDLSGIVTDATGGVLVGVTVTATDVQTNGVRSGATQADGRFVLPALPPGVYTVRLARAGFTTLILEQIAVPLGAVVELPVTLQVAGVIEEVTVVPRTRTVDLERTAVSGVIGPDQIDRLPINGRNFMSFSLLTPGTAVDRTPQQGVSQTSGLTFAGQRARANNITVDGLDNNDLIIGSVREAFSQDAVQEFQVLTNSYSAEFGKASGGVVNIVTKSGTNRLGGNVFAFFRDESLNAKEHFEKVDAAGNRIARGKAPYSQQQVGVTMGGPIRRNRAFFFGACERLEIDANNFVTIDDQTVVSHPFSGAPLGTPAGILRQAGFPVATGHVPYAFRTTQVLGKLTQLIGSTHHLVLRGNWSDGLNENIEPFGGIVARSRAGSSKSGNTVGLGSLTSVLSDRAVNEFRFQAVDYEVQLHALDPSCGGPCTREDQGGPNIEVTGVAGLGRQRTTPTVRDSLRAQVVDTFSVQRGSHALKAGLDFSAVTFRRYSVPLSFGGRFIFGSLPAIPGVLPGPVTAIQAVALGVPSTYVQGYGNSTIRFGYQDLSLFVQDDWRLAQTLTLKLGLRYQRQFWENDQYRVPGYPGAYAFPVDRNDVGPRIAVAWRPGDRRTSWHASYGMFFENTIAALRGVPSIVDGQDGVRTLALRAPRSIEAWTAPDRTLPESAVGTFPSVMITADPHLRTPYAHHVAAGVTHELPYDMSLSTIGIYARGFNLVGTIDFNPLVPSLGSGRRPLDVNGVAGTSASILQYSSFGETWYRGLTVMLEKRFRNRTQVLASYTWSKAEDSSTDFQSAFIVQDSGRGRDPANPDGLPLGFDPRTERGLSSQDQRHRLVVSGAALLPGAFQVSAILAAGSGRPYNILAGADLNGDGDGGAFPSDRARRVPADPVSSVPRNSGTMPAQMTVDTRLSRAFRLGARTTVDAIVEVFNVFNRVNYTEANNIFGRGAYPETPLPAFGRFEQAAPPRQVQLALRFRF